MRKPLCIDGFCGLGGWTEGFLAEGWDVVGFDIERHVYGERRYSGQLVIQDMLTVHGSQFACASCLVMSPPCQEFSYMAMPWKRAKQIASALRGEVEFPEGYTGSRTVAELTRLFDACFRIQREASEAAGRHVPMVVENVRGAEVWLGKAAWHYGSFYLWGDVPALMPMTLGRAAKVPGMNWSGSDKPGYKAVAFNDPRHLGTKNSGDSWFAIGSPGQKVTGQNPVMALAADGAARHGSKSNARKMASAMIAKIPLPLSRWIAHCYMPRLDFSGTDELGRVAVRALRRQ